MSKKLSQNFIKKELFKEGYELLSEYSSSYDKIKIKCPKGHEYEIKWNYFQQGRRCGQCYDRKKDVEEIHDE